MWKLDCEESWVPKNWCFWTVVLEKTLESPLDCKEIQPVHSKGDQSWLFFGRNDAKAEAPILCPPDAKSWLIGKDSDAGRDWGQEEKGTTGWDGSMASPTQWTWVWVNSWSWWWIGRPDVLWFMGSQKVGHDWATELTDWTDAPYIGAPQYIRQTLTDIKGEIASNTNNSGRCREPVWGITPMAKVMRKEAWHYAKVGTSLRGPPGDSQASTPKTRVCLLYCVMLSTYSSDINRGAVPPPPFSGKS